MALDGSGDFESIAAAIDAADEGDVVALRPGVYEEALTIDRHVSLVGLGDPASVVITPKNEPQECGRRVVVTCTLGMNLADGRLKNLTLRTGSEAGSVALLVGSGSSTIEGLVVDGDVVFEDGSTAVLLDSTISGTIHVRDDFTSPLIHNNQVGAVRIDRGARPTVVRNRLGGVEIRGSGLIRSNLVQAEDGEARPGSSIGIAIRRPQQGLILSENSVMGHRVGIDVTAGGSARIVANGIEGNRTGLRLDQVRDMDITGNLFCRNDVHVQVERGPELRGVRVDCTSGG